MASTRNGSWNKTDPSQKENLFDSPSLSHLNLTMPGFDQTPAIQRGPLAPIGGPRGKEFTPLLRTVARPNAQSNNAFQSGLSSKATAPLAPAPTASITPLRSVRTPQHNGILSFEELSDSMESAFSNKIRGNSKRPNRQSITDNTRSFKGTEYPTKNSGLVDEYHSLPLKEQEKLLQDQQNEIFALKMRVFVLSQQINNTTPEHFRETAKENAELKSQITLLQVKYSKVVHSMDVLETEKDTLLQKLENHQEIRQENHQDNHHSDNQSEMKDLQDELEDTQYQLRQSQQENTEKSLTIQDLEKEISSLNRKLKEAEESHRFDDSNVDDNEVQDLRQRVEDLEYENRTSERTLHDKEEEARELQSKLIELQREMEITTANRSARSSMFEESPSPANNVVEELAQSRAKETDLKNEILRISRELETTKQEKAISDNHLDRARSQLDSLTTEWNVKENRLNQDLKFAEDSLASKQRVLDNYSNDLDSYKRQLGVAELELEATKSQLSASDNKIISLQDRLQMLERNQETSFQNARVAETASETRFNSEIETLRLEIQQRSEDLEYSRREWNIEVSTDTVISTVQTNKKSLLEQKISNLTSEIKDYKQRIEEFLTEDKSDVSSNSHLMELLQFEKRRFQQMETSLKTDLERMMQEIKDLQVTLDDKSAEIWELKKKLSSGSGLQQSLLDLEDEILVIQGQLDEEEARRKQADLRLVELEAALTESRNQAAEMARISETKESQWQTSRAELFSRLEQTRLMDQTKLSQEQVRLSSLTSQVESYRNEIDISSQRIQSLAHELSLSEAKRKETENEVKDLKSKLNSLELDHERVTIERSRSIRSMEELKLKEQESINSLQKSQERIYKLTMEIVDLKTQQGITESQLSGCKSLIDDLNTQISNQHQHHTAELKKQKALAQQWDFKALQNITQPEIRGLVIQMKYLKDKAARQSEYRKDLEFMKRFFILQISTYQSYNEMDLEILQKMGIYPDYKIKSRARPTLKVVSFALIAAIRIRNRTDDRKDQLEIKKVLKECIRRKNENRFESNEDHFDNPSMFNI